MNVEISDDTMSRIVAKQSKLTAAFGFEPTIEQTIRYCVMRAAIVGTPGRGTKPDKSLERAPTNYSAQEPAA